MTHFAAYDTLASEAGELIKLGKLREELKKEGPTFSVELKEIEEAQKIDLFANTLNMLIESEWIQARRTGLETYEVLKRALFGTAEAAHVAAKEIKIATEMEYTLPILKGQEIILQSIQTDKAEKIGGSIWATQESTLYIEQSFDGEKHWDIIAKYVLTKAELEEGKGFEEPTLAPRARVRFIPKAEIKSGGAEGLRLFSQAHFTRQAVS